MAELTEYPDASDSDDGDVSKAAFAAAKMVIDKTAIDSSRDWQRAYENVVTAVGRRYKKYGQRENAVERGEGASERTKFEELLWQINMANAANIVLGGVRETLGRVWP